MSSVAHQDDPTNAHRPAVPPPASGERRVPLGVALLLAAAVYWIFAPLWPSLSVHILGDPDTDTLRGLWGFDHLRRSLIPPNTPLWSETINFPEGAVALILPWVSGQLLAPLGGLFGPIAGYNLGIAVLLWAAGFCTALLVYETSRSWFAAAIAGGAMLSQPMLLHAVGDGTPEHLAIWSVPLFLAAGHRALVRKTPRWGIIAGLAAGVVALDSPYHAIYALIAAPIVLPWATGRVETPAERTQLLWTLGAGLMVLLACGGLVAAIYSGFSISSSAEDSTELWQMNAADLRTWWKHEFNDTAVREASLAPTLIPSVMLWGGLVLCGLGLPRSLPWALAGALMIQLSLGLNPRLPLHLTFWIGEAPGQQLGRALLRVNETLYDLPIIGMIRFPQRWLVPAALCLLTGAGFGLARIGPYTRSAAPLIAAVLVAGAALIGVRCSHNDLGFPAQPAPRIDFAEWLAHDPRSGAVLTLPQTRPPPASGLRRDLPVFANLDSALTSADTLYFQTIHGRPIAGYPNFKTITGEAPAPPIIKLLRDWDDLSLPGTSQRPIPDSARDTRADATRQTGLRELYAKGLRWIVIDEGVYTEEA
ncbi:MAG: hypothetical protein ACI8S6_000580, partial [Myxococcota bacterium]